MATWQSAEWKRPSQPGELRVECLLPVGMKLCGEGGHRALNRLRTRPRGGARGRPRMAPAPHAPTGVALVATDVELESRKPRCKGLGQGGLSPWRWEGCWGDLGGSGGAALTPALATLPPGREALGGGCERWPSAARAELMVPAWPPGHLCHCRAAGSHPPELDLGARWAFKV